MERLRRLLGDRPAQDQEYERVPEGELLASEGPDAGDRRDSYDRHEEAPFSWLEYGIFVLLGVAMLWAWCVVLQITQLLSSQYTNTLPRRNMFLAAAEYFRMRFESAPGIASRSQSAILAVSTVTNLTIMLILQHMQVGASYPFRINLALIINTVVFSMLAASTIILVDVAPGWYLAFLLTTVAISTYGTALMQNGAFAFAASFGRAEYMQAIMAGQGIAGVLPPMTQILSVLSVGGSTVEETGGSGTAAFVYFLTAVAVSLMALLAFIPLARRHGSIMESRLAEQMGESMASVEDAENAARKETSMRRLFSKLPFLSTALVLCFTVTMFFPVFTAKIFSVHDGKNVPALLRPDAFVPLGFFVWNLGDLMGRVATALPFSLRHRPVLLFLMSLARVGMVPLYLLCNIGGRGAKIESDFFYLFVVQLLFGLTNGWLGSSCMMAAGEWVDEGEREAAGGFMGLCLVLGLTLGSLLSFTAAGA